MTLSEMIKELKLDEEKHGDKEVEFCTNVRHGLVWLSGYDVEDKYVFDIGGEGE